MTEEKKAFIVTPIGKVNTTINDAAKGLIETILKPVLTEMGFEINNPMEDSSAGSITNQIIGHIVEDNLVVVNLTGLNPNVMYELALRHSTDKPVVILIRRDQLSNLPFDIKDERLIPFNDSLYGVKDLKRLVKKHIDEAMKGKDHSPVYNATQKISIVKGGSSEKDMISYMESMKDSIDNLQSEIKAVSNENIRSNTITDSSVSNKIDILSQALSAGLLTKGAYDSIANSARNDNVK